MGRKKQKKEETRIVENPLLERMFAHYRMHPNDRITGEIVDNYHAEQYQRYCMNTEQKKVVFLDKDGNRTIV